MPFPNLSSDPTGAYFSEALTEELIGALGRIDGLRVPGYFSNSVFQNHHDDVQVIGQSWRSARSLPAAPGSRQPCPSHG